MFAFPEQKDACHRAQVWRMHDMDTYAIILCSLLWTQQSAFWHDLADAVIAKWQTAQWQSGYAADCKSVYVGSIPACASR